MHSAWYTSCLLQMCERTAKDMANLLTVPERKLTVFSSSAGTQLGRAGLTEELKRFPGVPDPVLLETLPKGVAFHHAGVLFSGALCMHSRNAIDRLQTKLHRSSGLQTLNRHPVVLCTSQHAGLALLQAVKANKHISHMCQCRCFAYAQVDKQCQGVPGLACWTPLTNGLSFIRAGAFASCMDWQSRCAARLGCGDYCIRHQVAVRSTKSFAAFEAPCTAQSRKSVTVCASVASE